MKAVIDKLDDVTEGLRGEYKAGEGGKFFLVVEGLEEGSIHPSVTGLLSSKRHEVEAHGKTKAELEAVRVKLHEKLKGGISQSDVEALEASYKVKLASVEDAGRAASAALTASLRGVLVESEARRLAGKIAVTAPAAELLTELIQRRLTVEIGTDGKAAARVLSSTGQPSALSVDDLEKEIVATPKYAGLLLGSRASGGGAQGSAGAGGASSGKVDWLRGDPADIAAAATKKNPILGG